MQEFLKINREDTVAVAFKPLSKGSTVEAEQNTVDWKEDIPQGHKFAVCQMPEGAPVIKYGCRIGYASRQIRPGDWVHIHNVRTALGDVLRSAQRVVDSSHGRLREFSGHNGVAFAHPYGCSQMGEDQENTRKVLADIINHPNAGGVLVLGLGCENCNIPVLMDYIGEYDPERVKFLQCQDCEYEI